jgi:hypothetical protein
MRKYDISSFDEEEFLKKLVRTLENHQPFKANGTIERNGKHWLTSKEFREITGFSRAYEHQLRSKQTIPFSRHGRTIRYDYQDVVEFMDSRKNRKLS